MSLKILGGTLKGMEIKSSSLSHKNSVLTRPTSVILRRKLFDANQDLSGIMFIDLCAGTGAMGFEALSRGANSIHLSDISKFNIKLLDENSKNIKKRAPEAKITISTSSFERVLKSAISFENSIIFFDPPYEQLDLYDKFSKWLKNTELINCRVIIEFCRQKTMKQELFENIFGKPDKSYQQGTSFLSVYVF